MGTIVRQVNVKQQCGNYWCKKLVRIDINCPANTLYALSLTIDRTRSQLIGITSLISNCI